MSNAREQIHDTLQATAANDPDLEGSVVLGWVMVAEWMDGDGKRWLSRMCADARKENASDWAVQGYLFSALYEGDRFDEREIARSPHPRGSSAPRGSGDARPRQTGGSLIPSNIVLGRTQFADSVHAGRTVGVCLPEKAGLSGR